MTDDRTSMTAEAPRFPAPGSSVPGAPPPLKRPLTPADGVLVGSAQGAPMAPAGRAPLSPGVPDVSAPTPTTSPLLAAAAMLGVAVGLELAGLLSRRSLWRRARDRPLKS